MKLFEMAERPSKHGQATVVFDPQVNFPVRQKRTIHLPEQVELEYYPLARGRQFLVRIPASIARDRETQVWFGGTDERPFLVRLQVEAFMSFVHGGEEGFFTALIPKEAAQLAGQLSLKLRRQGDIFAIDLAADWEEILKASRLINGQAPQPTSHTTPVFGTRHEVSGLGVAKLSLYGKTLTFVSSGKLQAPDHRPLDLERPHVLFQAGYLWSPKDAD